MRMLNFAKRNFKELIRDPLSLVFAIALPLFLLFIFQQFNIPNEAYKLENFTAGIIVFGFSFITLFTATLVAKDRTTSFLIRLGISPMKPADYILGYILSIVPLIAIQNVLFFVLAVIMGLAFSAYIILAAAVSVLVSVLFISLGIMLGSVVSEKAASGVASIVVQLVCFTSGMYFPLELLGDGFGTVCRYLPFESAVVLIKGIMNNTMDIITLRNVAVFAIYSIVALLLSVWLFRKKMLSDNK